MNERFNTFNMEEAGFTGDRRPRGPSSVFKFGASTDGIQKDNSDKMLPSYCILGLFLWLVLMGYTTSVIDDAMPTVVTEKDAGVTQFSEERSWTWLRRIVGSGPRVAGTKYHLEQTEVMKALLDEVKGNDTRMKIDWQIVSGDFWLDNKRPYVNAYTNVSNLIVLLQGDSGFNENGTTNSSVLFNCHYDSVPTSPGASDNALFCAAMVEVLYILSKSDQRLKHNIIFLFNGAEENPLQGSAGFLKHPWAHGVTALVNLDSAGMNCKSMLFQVTDPRVLTSYSRSVSKPSAQAFGEVLFSSGIVPSDTDFRIFRDFAGIYGVDIAFSKQGHVYHTRHDSLENLRPGVIQHSGDMLLALARDMGNEELFYEKSVQSTAVYWDYLNIVMFVYSYNTAFFVDLTVIVIGVASVYYYLWIVGLRWSTKKELLLAILGRLLSCTAGLAAIYILTVMMYFTTPQLRYLSHGWIVVPLFWLPFLLAAVTFSQYYDKWRSNKCGLNRARRFAQSMAATRTILILITIILLCLPNTATARYIITIPLLLSSVTSVISLTVLRWRKIQAWQHLLLELLLATPALLMYFVVAVKVNTLMLPIMGRSPTDSPDSLIAKLNALCVILACLPLSGIELLFSRRRKWAVFLSFLLACLVVCFIPLSPYKDGGSFPVLQRHYWFHSEMKTFDLNLKVTSHKSGIWFARIDANTARSVRQLSNSANLTVTDLTCDNSTVFCGLPTMFPRMTENAPKSLWADFEAPFTSNPAPELLMQKACDSKQCQLTFSIVGPPHMSISIIPTNSNLTSWSLSAPLKASFMHKERPVYFIYWTKGTYTATIEPIFFSLTFEVNNANNSLPLVEISFNAHRTSHNEEFTPSYKRLLELMPKYSNIATTLSSRYDYVF